MSLHDKLSVGEMSLHGKYGEIWRKICHVEKFLHMRDVETNLFCHNSCCFVVKSVLLPYTLFCWERYFVAIYALLCGEKFNQKLCLWRKMDKYQVCCTVTQQGLCQQIRLTCWWCLILLLELLYHHWFSSPLVNASTSHFFSTKGFWRRDKLWLRALI